MVTVQGGMVTIRGGLANLIWFCSFNQTSEAFSFNNDLKVKRYDRPLQGTVAAIGDNSRMDDGFWLLLSLSMSPDGELWWNWCLSYLDGIEQ